MKQKQKVKTEKGTVALMIAVMLCTAVLLILMTITFMLTSATSGLLNNKSPLDSSVLLSEEAYSTVSIDDCIIPAFIGVGTADSRKGISAGDNVIHELYGLLVPFLANGFCTEPVQMDYRDWENAVDTYPHVFIQYHSPMPIEFLQATGAADEARMAVGSKTLLTDTLFLQPDKTTGLMNLLVKTTDGTVLKYSSDSLNQDEYPSMNSLVEWVQNFPNNFYRYDIRLHGNVTEPVFQERIRVQSITMANSGFEMLESNENHMYRFLRFLDFNPDKLSRHEEADGTKVFVETHGVLQTYGNKYWYTASSEGGIALNSIIGYKENYSVYDTISAAWTIVERMRGMSPYYLGGEAEVVLSSCVTDDAGITLYFAYAFDNLLIGGMEPAMVITVSNDYRILSLELTAFTATGWGEYRTVYTETGVWDQKKSISSSIILTYPVNYFTESIFPSWTECTVVGNRSAVDDFRR